MNRNVDGQWAQAGGLAALGAAGADDDMSNFVDFEHLDFGFADFDQNVGDSNNVSGTSGHHQQPADGDLSNDVQWRGTDFDQSTQSYSGDNKGHLMGSYHSTPNLMHHHNSGSSIDNGFQPRQNIPPTPNSSTLHPNVGQLQRNYSDLSKQQQHNGRFQFNPAEQFTPLMTPDGSVTNSAYSIVPDYVIPAGFNMSPLTSPAMFPQQNRDAYQLQHINTAESSMSGSPLDPTFQDRYTNAPETHDERPRKTRKKDSTSGATTPVARSRQPSKSLASKRRGSLSIPTSAKAPIRKGPAEPQSAIEPRASSGLHTAPQSPHSSTNPSVSPRPLSDVQMAPPPKPVTPAGTPRALAQDHQSKSQGKLPPATPASLMKMNQQKAAEKAMSSTTPQQGALASPSENALEFLSLPEAAEPVLNSPTAQTSHKDGANQAGVSRSKPASATASPALNGLKSPGGFANGIKQEGGSNRNSKKRNSTSTNLVSPALRPKISPSIRPMLPSGSQGLSTTAHELLLASKSNYQNILEGNALPGMNYPSELATNLTSKRTSHKIAEQGRRNRINTALQEMQSLLPLPLSAAAAKDEPIDAKSALDGDTPPSPVNGSGNGSAKGGAEGKKASPGASSNGNNKANGNSAHGGNSKAATVELAIEYIKQLKAETLDKDAEIERLKQQMAELKAVGGSVSASDTPMGDADDAIPVSATANTAHTTGSSASPAEST